MVLTKKDLNREIDRLRQEYAECKQNLERYEKDVEKLISEKEVYKTRNEGLNFAVNQLQEDIKEAKKQAAEYKQELDALNDTKKVLTDLKFILSNPHNDYQKVVDELNGMLIAERNRANNSEQELRNLQSEIRENNYLRGKVEAYETIIRPELFNVEKQ